MSQSYPVSLASNAPDAQNNATALGIQSAYQNYYTFVNGAQAIDNAAYQSNLQQWLSEVDAALSSGDKSKYGYLLESFWNGIMASSNASTNNASYTHNMEDQLTELSQALNYASAFTSAVADIKNDILSDAQNTSSTGSGLSNVSQIIEAMNTFMGPNAFPDANQEIFQNGSTTFSNAFSSVQGVLDKINGFKDPTTGTTTTNGAYSSLNDLYTKATQMPGSGSTTASTAANDWQTLINGVDALSSAVSVQQNVLSTKVQDTEANYNSMISSLAQGLNSLQISIVNFVVQHMISN